MHSYINHYFCNRRNHIFLEFYNWHGLFNAIRSIFLLHMLYFLIVILLINDDVCHFIYVRVLIFLLEVLELILV